MGKLGWTERDYYTSSPEAVYYAFRGYFSKLQDESLAIRNAATILFRVMGGKENMNNIWPLDNEERENRFQKPDLEWWQKMKAKQAIIDKQIKAEING